MSSRPDSGIARPRAPMFSLALSFAVGILLAHQLWRPSLWIGVAVTVFAIGAASMTSRRPRLAWCIAHLAVVALGWLAFTGQRGRNSAETPDLEKFVQGDEITLIGNVFRTPKPHEDGFAQVDVETESLQLQDRKFPVAAGMRINLYARKSGISASALGLQYGDRIRLSAKLRRPKNFRNPGALDYAGYLRSRGIVAIGSARVDSVIVLGHSPDRLGEWRSELRRAVLERIHRLWPEDQAVLMDAMLIGERSAINPELTASFQRSGTYHVLVVSGMNVGILAMVLFWVMRRLRAGEIAASLLTVTVAGGYAFLCDGGAPIIRATLMLAIYLMARLFYRNRSPLNAVGIAATTVMLSDPASLFDASFQLTFLCVLVIAGLGIPLLERTSDGWRRGLQNLQSTGYDLALPPKVVQFRLDLRMIASRAESLAPEPLVRWVMVRAIRLLLGTWEVLLISALMQVALALPMAIYFHRATLTGLAANMLVVPLTGVLMPSSALALAVSYVSERLAQLPAHIAGWSLNAMTGAVRIAGSLQIADLRLATPSLLVSAFAVLAFILALVCARRRRWASVLAMSLMVVSSCAVIAWPAKPQTHRGALEVTAIDVGQADSTLIISPEGQTLLLDAAGPLGFVRSSFDFGENVVSPYLWQRGFARLDVVAISHGHSDHIGGMLSVINNFRPRELWTAPLPAKEDIQNILKRAKELDVRVRLLQAGDEFVWSSTSVKVLAPPRDAVLADEPENDQSLALRISYGKTSVLLEGDSETKAERFIASQQPRATLLKVAHNGSMTSTTPELLEAVRPTHAFISVGTRNSFRHPRPEILKRLANGKIRTYRTDTMGLVSFLLDGQTVTLLQ